MEERKQASKKERIDRKKIVTISDEWWRLREDRDLMR